MIAARGDGPHLSDPNWYRVRYALAVQFIELATLSTAPPHIPEGGPRSWTRRGSERLRRRKSVGQEALGSQGWPEGIEKEDGDWRDDFGDVTADTLGDLFLNRAAGREHLDQAAKSARLAAEELLAAASGTLERAGWFWVGRRPPRFVRWKRAISPRRIARRAPVLDRELVRFLSWVVEPASVTLLFSAWLVEERGVEGEGPVRFPFAEFKQAITGHREPEALDRRERLYDGSKDRVRRDWLIAYLARLIFEPPQHTLGARVQARLGRTQLRSSREPSFRVQYNLACLFSRLVEMANHNGDSEGASQFMSIAAGQLERALFRLPEEQRNRLAKWAETDPGLALLRDQRAGEFAEIITRWGAGDKQERRLDDPILLRRLRYDPGSALLDVYMLDGTKRRYGGVPQSVVDSLFGPLPKAHAGSEREARREMEKAFVENLERDYPPIRP
jgi:hypothetical protein